MNISMDARVCLELAQIKGFGLKQFHLLREHFGALSAWRDLDRAEIAAIVKKPSVQEQVISCLTQDHDALAPHIAAWLETPNSYIVSYFDEHYPAYLRETHLAPAVLYMKGRIDLLKKPSLAIVGSRKPSPSYTNLASECAYQLAKNDWVVVSGLAKGVDESAHKGALAANGCTIAVVATGVDRCYPVAHQALYEQISQHGLILSEMPLGTPPLKHNFPRRNRIVSGLAQGVLVVEAGIKSGSLITARYALEQNREVFAVPGAPSRLTSQGCNFLLRDGARLISSAEELCQDLGDLPMQPNVSNSENALGDADIKAQVAKLPGSQQALIRLIGPDILSFDAIYASLNAESSVDFGRLSEDLLSLELAGYICTGLGGYQCVS